jgi:cytochrome c-type biogenesis protein CcmE
MTSTTDITPTVKRGLHIKPLHLAGIGIIVLAILFGVSGFQEAFRSYTTSISEARASGKSVQLAGYLGNTGEYDPEGRWTFLFEDSTGEQITVVFDGARPANFEHATSIVAIGHYDKSRNVFAAEDLLVKCPSKYQEEQAQEI